MAGRYRVIAEAEAWTVTVTGAQATVSGVDGIYTMELDGDGRAIVDGPDGRFEAVAVRRADRVWVMVDGHALAFTVVEGTGRRTQTGVEQDALAAPMAATVVRIPVAPGAVVHDGDLLIALEAMKMELPIRAPRDGVVAAIHCREGELVQQGTMLVDLE